MNEHVYRYAAPSVLDADDGGRRLSLASDTSAAPEGEAVFLEARALQPEITAKGLRVVSEIVGSRFYVPPSMLAKILREADPVATVGADAVRFEGFSACCSAYVRHDIGEDALEVRARRKGTTNVDFGPEVRGALAGVGRDSDLGLKIGSDTVEIATGGKAMIEKKVPLPTRWLRGFAEVQRAIAGMEPGFSLPRVAAQRFLRGLPRGKNDQLVWLSASGQTVRSSAREAQGAVPLRGSHRLRVFEALSALADRLDVHVNRVTGATAWTLDFGPQRVMLVLNVEPWRGFSGDGGLLHHIAKDAQGMAAVRAHLHWQDHIVAAELAETTGLSDDAVETALAQLASAGQLGFDLATGAYFHRVLPFDMTRIDALNPRLKAAKALVSDGAVRRDGERIEVQSENVVHRVSLDDEGWRCTCPWYAKNGRARGPCKHILAAELELDG